MLPARYDDDDDDDIYICPLKQHELYKRMVLGI